MTYLLGIDTGGTFTDAALLDESTEELIAKVKAPTTHGNLVVGVRGAMANVLAQLTDTDEPGTLIRLVSVSTTLATNALVEGSGEPAALITLGFADTELARAGVGEVSDSFVCPIPGGHNAHGNPLCEVDLEALDAVIDAHADRVSGFAVAGQFSVRNPGHENQVRDHIIERTGLPVTCSHELSPQLGGPRRALTALLNARLIGLIAELIDAVQSSMTDLAIDAPLMIVRGNGTLVADSFAVKRPIETVLSGPAASVIGARHLTDIADGLVIDIGGTTSDVAVIIDGVARTTSTGALVAGHRTMVEAVDMVTEGLGGDSEVRVDTRADDGPVVIGPQRAIPISTLAVSHAQLVHDTLDRQLREAPKAATDARFVVPVGTGRTGHDDREQAVLDLLDGSPKPLAALTSTGLAHNAVARLRARGAVAIAAFTPTDASHVLGTYHLGDEAASGKAAEVLARQSRSNGAPMAESRQAFAQLVVDDVIVKSADILLRAALAGDDLGTPAARDGLEHSVLASAGLAQHRGLVEVSIGLGHPVVAIGAPAAAYEPLAAQRLATTAVTPEHGDVANAVGAVVGRVRLRRQATVSQPTKGQFRVHLADQPTFGSVERARDAALELLIAELTEDARQAGTIDPLITHEWSEKVATVENKEVFVDGLLVVTATGRPTLD